MSTHEETRSGDPDAHGGSNYRASVNTTASPAYRLLNATDRDAIISKNILFSSEPALKVRSTMISSDMDYLVDGA